MLRNTLAVVAGYLVMAALTVASVYALTLANADYAQAGRDGTTPPTSAIILNLLLGMPCAAAGGYLTARLARGRQLLVVAALAGLVLVFGVAYGWTGRDGPHPGWYLALLPVLGSLGILVGGRMGIRSQAS